MVSPSTGGSSRHVVVAQFAGAHGVRGEFKLRSFTENPADLFGYGELHAPDGRTLTPTKVREIKPGLFVVRAPEIADREASAAFTGSLLLVPRHRLPPPDEDEFYHEDLVGMTARQPGGAFAGRVKAIVNYGAGDIVELEAVPDRKGVVLLPFTRDQVPVVNMSEGWLEVILPEVEDDTPPDDA